MNEKLQNDSTTEENEQNNNSNSEVISYNELINEKELDSKSIKKQSLILSGLGYLQSIKIKEICSNHFASHFLSEDGIVYSYGKDLKKYGVLGLGTSYELQQPKINTNLQELKIVKIAMGLSHCCALTTSGQLFTWGTGLNGQLCHQDDTMISNIPNNKGKLCMFGTLKGFAKFLFDSPSKEINKSNVSVVDPNNNNSDQSNSVISDRVVRKFKLKLGKESVTKVALSEKQFIVYCQDTHNLYCVNENFEPVLILQRELKNFQYLNGSKNLIAQDQSMLILMSQQSDETQTNIEQHDKWQIVKEFDLTKLFGIQDITMTPSDLTQKSQTLQQLSFTVNQPPKKIQQGATFNKHYYKSFLNSNNQNQTVQQSYQYTQSSFNNQTKSSSSNMFQVVGRNKQYPNNFNHPTQIMNNNNNSNYDNENNSVMCDSKYNSAYQTKTRNKLKLKIDSIFGDTFSARKNRSNSTSIKERAKKLHQSLSPISRFPIINNLCEFIKQQQKRGGVGQDIMNSNQVPASPGRFGTNILTQSVNETPFTFDNMNKKYQDQIKSPQYNLFIQSLNLACQLSILGNQNNDGGVRQSQKQMQFLSKADKIRQELKNKQTIAQQVLQQQTTMQNSHIVNYDSVNRNNQTGGSANLRGQFDMIELASPETSRNDQVNNMPLQIDSKSNISQSQSIKNQDMPLQTLSVQNSHNNLNQKLAQTLSCIYEDRETSTMIQNQQQSQQENRDRQIKKTNQRQPSMNILDYHTNRLLDSNQKQPYEYNNQAAYNMDTISDISGLQAKDFSINRISQYGGASDITNTNNYKILVMNARNVIEKKVLQHLMVGFMAIKYHQNNTFQSFRLQSSINYSQKTLNFMDDDRFEQGLNIIEKIQLKYHHQEQLDVLTKIQDFAIIQQERKRIFKKIFTVMKQKEEQSIMDAMRKIQLSIRFKKLQRLNINLLFNSLGKVIKRLNKQDSAFSFFNIQQYYKQKRKIVSLQKMDQILLKKDYKLALKKFQKNSEFVSRVSKAVRLLKKTHSQIIFRKQLNQKSQALYQLRKNVINFQISRTDKIQSLLQRLDKKKYFKQWYSLQQKRKIAIQQAIFLKMFIQDKLKQTMYYAILKLINHSHHESQSQTKKSCLSKSNQHDNLQNITQEGVLSNINEVSRKLEFAEKSIQNDDNYEDLDIEDTQLDDGDYYQIQKLSKASSSKNQDLPFKKTSGKEFSFEKYELANGGEYYQGQENNMTAHFHRFNLMSKAKDSNNFLNSNSAFKEQRPHYHCHYANEEKVAPEAFTLDPSSNTRNSVSYVKGHSRENSNNIRLSIPKLNLDKSNNFTEHKRELQLQLSQASKMRMSIQDEISPTNNIKNYQRQANFNKNYEQSDPFELPVNDEEQQDFPQMQLNFNQEYKHFIDNNLEHSNIADDGMIQDPLYIEQNQNQEYQPRYSIKNVVPFNPPEDTPSDNYLRQQNYNINTAHLQSKNQQHLSINQSMNKHQVFDSKKGSNASSLVNSQANSLKGTFINNYFTKLSAQNSAKNENKNQQNHQQPPKQAPTLFQAGQSNGFSKNKENLMQYNIPQNSGQLNSHQSSQQQYMHQSSHPLTQQSFVTNNNNIDIMHFNSHSDNTSFVFFDDNFWRESGISSASRVSNLGKLGHLVNQSFGQSLHSNSQFQHQQQLRNRMMRQTQNNTINQGLYQGQQLQYQTMGQQQQDKQNAINLQGDINLNSGRYN